MGQKVSVEYLRGLQVFTGTKCPDNSDNIALPRVDFRIEMAHFGLADLASEVGESSAKLRIFFERGIANDGDRVVRREIMAIVLERDQVERVDETVSGIAGNDIDLPIDECTIDKSRIHDTGSCGKVKIVAIAPAMKTVGALDELVTDSDAPLGRDRG